MAKAGVIGEPKFKFCRADGKYIMVLEDSPRITVVFYYGNKALPQSSTSNLSGGKHGSRAEKVKLQTALGTREEGSVHLTGGNHS